MEKKKGRNSEGKREREGKKKRKFLHVKLRTVGGVLEPDTYLYSGSQILIYISGVRYLFIFLDSDIHLFRFLESDIYL